MSQCLTVDLVGTSALVSLAVKVHAMLTLHSDDAVGRALIVELAVALVREINLVDGVGILFQRLPARRSLCGCRAQHHHQCWWNVRKEI